MLTMLKRFKKDESGAAAVEYGILVGLIAIVIIGAVTLVGVDLDALFTAIATKLAAI
jgi:pilus assembly protein Flp/PilA